MRKPTPSKARTGKTSLAAPNGVRVGVVAPSSVVPPVEFELGIERLRADGYEVKVHRQCRKKRIFFAGSAEERADAFLEFARDPGIDVIWCARGGYGANHLLPLLARETTRDGIPASKLLVGFSDATALLHFVRSQWGWSTLHAAMPAAKAFTLLKRADREALNAWVQRRQAREPWSAKRLRFIGSVRPKAPLEAEVVGGNLAVWNVLVGTPYAPRPEGSILFLEEISETFSKIDRMVHHLRQAGGLDGIRGIVLGDFLDCNDVAPKFLNAGDRKLWERMAVPSQREKALTAPSPKWLAPIRPVVSANKALAQIFGTLGDELGIPVAAGLPVGHGPGHSPLPLGARYRLDPDGRFEVIEWDWTR